MRVLIVDDHPAFRRALTSALRMVKGIEVAGEAGGGEEATFRARVDDPDLVLMDLSMPDFDGIEAMRKIHREQPDLPVVILTVHDDPVYERTTRAAGADEFLLKKTAGTTLWPALVPFLSRDPGQAPEEVERHALGGEDGARAAFNLHDFIAGPDGGAFLPEPFDG